MNYELACQPIPSADVPGYRFTCDHNGRTMPPRTDIAAPSGSLHRLPRRHDLDLRQRAAPVPLRDDGQRDRPDRSIRVVSTDLLDVGMRTR